MYEYTYVYENADKILDYYLDNPTNKHRFEDSEFSKVVSDLALISQALKQLHTDTYVTIDGHHSNYYTITGAGTTFAKNGGYEKYFENLNRQDEEQKIRTSLSDKKLGIDIANAERIFKTYWWTFGISIAAFLISLYLLILRIGGK